MEKIQIQNYELPNGGIYTGDAKKNGFFINLSGRGEVKYLDGSSYVGHWEDNCKCGLGKYSFADGDFHFGYFNDIPNGIGYLCLNTIIGMRIGMFQNGKLNGWAISIIQGVYHFGWWNSGKPSPINKNEITEWMHEHLLSTIFMHYSGNMVQVSKEEYGYIRYGAPSRRNHHNILLPPIGYTFIKDGTVIIGEVSDPSSLNGHLIVCKPNGNIIMGNWRDNELIQEESLETIKKRVVFQFFKYYSGIKK